MLDRDGIAKRIRDLRGHLTQKKFGDIMGFSQGQIGHIETGRSDPSLLLLLEISKYYGISIDYIIKGFEPYDTSLGIPPDSIGTKTKPSQIFEHRDKVEIIQLLKEKIIGLEEQILNLKGIKKSQTQTEEKKNYSL